ncbi:MBL fold metallo-hydrolase [Patulibacter sp. SYSU D01012]|uniref:MBL fold metallo-hydrolase n=1 Tax=Patulibacter sp. SYSU D01012 TaxID=2817381 RepID=UPI001B3184C5|nr:MBL fold metallo-hydrolase [Patulibacter sp. SYSU D01012]
MADAADAALRSRGIALLRADNPGPKTLEGTNTWVVAAEDGAWVVDPGPDLAPHLDAVAAAADARGGLRGVALTHRHDDHADGVRGLLERAGAVPVATSTGWLPDRAPAGTTALTVGDGDAAGPFGVMATPGHAADHVAFLAGDAAFVGDFVLGRGSVLLVPHERALARYLDALRTLRDRAPALLLPGHGPVVTDPVAKLDEYVAHRLDRERALVAALDAGARTADELLDAVWGDEAPGILRLAAAVTLRAHLDKLDEEGRLPAGVERQEFGDFDGL